MAGAGADRLLFCAIVARGRQEELTAFSVFVQYCDCVFESATYLTTLKIDCYRGRFTLSTLWTLAAPAEKVRSKRTCYAAYVRLKLTRPARQRKFEFVFPHRPRFPVISRFSKEGAMEVDSTASGPPSTEAQASDTLEEKEEEGGEDSAELQAALAMSMEVEDAGDESSTMEGIFRRFVVSYKIYHRAP